MNWLIKKIIANKKYKLVSFDVFDTLIERDVEDPTEIFYRVGEDILGKGQGESFRSDRIIAEKTARSKKDRGEVTLSEIYMDLPEKYRNFIHELSEAEVREELKSCHTKKKGQELFDFCKYLGKKIIIITDMYLPCEVIESILHDCGYIGYSYIYVSNVYGCSKRRGGLYQKVLFEEKIEGKEMLHIGDSLKADFLSARANKIGAFLMFRSDVIKRKLYDKGFRGKR